jgi:hypothetical protein
MGHYHVPRLVLAISLILASFSASAVRASAPQTTDAAAVVIRYGDGTYTVHTVQLAGGTITGLQLLTAAGLAVIDQQGLICKIGREGCDYPEDPCTCQMPNYWVYWIQGSNGWALSGQGAGARLLVGGDVDGWIWGRGSQLPDITAEAIFDTQRLAPQAARVLDSTSGIVLDFQGDSNGNATLTASAALANPAPAVAAPIALPVTRAANRFTIATSLLAPGSYDIALELYDADGINGTSVWSLELAIPGEPQEPSAFLPFVAWRSQPTQPAPVACGCLPDGYTR